MDINCKKILTVDSCILNMNKVKNKQLFLIFSGKYLLISTKPGEKSELGVDR
jgi:hypothetical protein